MNITIKGILRRSLVIASLLIAMTAAAKMTDQQVIEYIKRQSAVGKTEQQIGKELLAKGVTPEQVERLRSQYEKEYDADGKEINAFAQGEHLTLVPGAMLTNTKWSTKQQDTVVYFILESYQIVPQDQQAA